MALSGSISTNNYQGRYYNLSWTATQSIETNSSNISWTLTANGGKANWYAERLCQVVINGTYVFNKSNRVERYKGKVASGTITIPHNTNGTMSFSASLKVACYKDSANLFGSGSWNLDKIPRQATITAAPNFNDEENPKITYSNPAGTDVSTLQACISLDGSKDDIAYRDISKTGTSYTFNLTDNERNILRNATTTSNSRTVLFCIKTKIGENTFYEKVSKTLSIVNANPVITPYCRDSNETTKALTGNENKLVRYYSDLYFIIEKSALKGATFKNVKVECGSRTTSTANLSAGVMTNIDSGVVKFTATDSRGNTTSQLLLKSFVNYIKLTCNMKVSAPTTDGSLNITASGNYFNGSFGAVNNSLTVQYRYKTNGGSYTSWTPMTTSISGNTYSASASITGLNYKSSYTFQTRAVDKLLTINSPEKTVKTVPIFDWGANDFNFNVDTSVNGDLTITGDIIIGGQSLKSLLGI